MWPDEGSYVIRYGESTCAPEVLHETATNHYRKIHARDGRCEYAISVHVGPPGCPPPEIAAFGQRPNPRFGYTTMRAIRQAGFEVACEMDEYCHTNILLPKPLSGADCARLGALFTNVGNNPRRTPLHQRTPPVRPRP
jgi:hypothetical protein